MVEQLQLMYEIPLFIYIVLGGYTLYQLMKAKRILTDKSPLSDTYKWFIIATGFFTLWAVDHIYHDLIPLAPALKDFFHFVISHGFQLLGMISVAIAAWKTQQFAYSWKEK